MIGLLFPNVKGKRGVFIRGLVTVVPAIALVILAVVLPHEVTVPLNTFAWVFSNALLGYSAIVLTVFLLAYFYYFDPRATTGGRLIFQFMLSLVGVITLNIIGIFINPSANNIWYLYPDGVEPWRPVVRLVIYGFVAYAVTSLAVLLVLRKWFPHKLKKATDIPLKMRTAENPTITLPMLDEPWPHDRGTLN